MGLHIPTRIAQKQGDEAEAGGAYGGVGPGEGGQEDIPAPVEMPEPLTGRMPIAHKEIEKYGYTDGCPGCEAKKKAKWQEEGTRINAGKESRRRCDWMRKARKDREDRRKNHTQDCQGHRESGEQAQGRRRSTPGSARSSRRRKPIPTGGGKCKKEKARKCRSQNHG